MPVFTGTNTARPCRTTNTPSRSSRVVSPSVGAGAEEAEAGREMTPDPASSVRRTIRPAASSSTSRTVVAWMGTASDALRVAVVISAVQVKPGRTPGMSPSTTTTTRKFVASCVALPAVPACGWIGLLPISVTRPV